jgi:nitrate reductase gamma subunit
MAFMIGQRVLAVLLFLIAFVAMTLSHTFSFLDDLPELAETAIVVGGVACALAGVSLWFRRTSEESSPETTGDAEGH